MLEDVSGGDGGDPSCRECLPVVSPRLLSITCSIAHVNAETWHWNTTSVLDATV